MIRIRAFLQTSSGRAVVLGAAVAVIAVATFAVLSLMRPAPAAVEPSPTAIVTPSPSATATASPPPSPAAFAIEEGVVQVLADGIAMQASPGTDADAIAQLSKGQTLWATGAGSAIGGNAWIEVRQEPSQRVGWVSIAMADGQPSLAIVHDGAIGVTAGADAELIDLASAERTPLTSGMSVHDLAFAPDGEQVALLDPGRGAQVVPINSITAPEPTPGPTGGVFGPPAMLHPAYAPNGDAVAYLEGQDFLGLSLLWLGTGPAPDFATPLTLFPLSWSPDSLHIASAQPFGNSGAGPDRENWEIVVSEDDGSDPMRLTRREGIDATPAWSPDGSTIAYLQQVDRGTDTLALMDTDGGNQRGLLTFDGFVSMAGSAMQPAWSPDGSRIAIAQTLAGQSAVIHLVDVHTSEHLSIPAPASECRDLTWSPTGSHIAFVCTNDQVESNAYVVEVGFTNVMTLGPAWHVDWARTLEPMTLP